MSSTQELLNGKGASLTVDGDFGPLTTTATKNFQSSRGLSVRGTTSCPALAHQHYRTLVQHPAPSLRFDCHAYLQADGIVGPNTKTALYATTGGTAPATGSLATVLGAARAEKGGEPGFTVESSNLASLDTALGRQLHKTPSIPCELMRPIPVCSALRLGWRTQGEPWQEHR